jgi:Uma2 family endonuclease
MSKSPLHEAIAQRLLELLFVRVPKGYAVRPERPLSLADSEPEPDLSVIKGTVSDWLVAHPSSAELVVEVAVTSLGIDEGKADIYAEAGIAEYWLVRAEEKAIDVYRGPTDGGYLSRETISGEASIRAVAVPGLSVTLSEIF